MWLESEDRVEFGFCLRSSVRVRRVRRRRRPCWSRASSNCSSAVRFTSAAVPFSLLHLWLTPLSVWPPRCVPPLLLGEQTGRCCSSDRRPVECSTHKRPTASGPARGGAAEAESDQTLGVWQVIKKHLQMKICAPVKLETQRLVSSFNQPSEGVNRLIVNQLVERGWLMSHQCKHWSINQYSICNFPDKLHF